MRKILSMTISKEKSAIRIIKANKGIIRTNEAIKNHIHPRTLYSLRDKGTLEQISYGLYKLKQNKISNPDLVTVALKVPDGVICLISTLAFYKERKKFNPAKLVKYAKICRVENVMRPYIESII